MEGAQAKKGGEELPGTPGTNRKSEKSSGNAVVKQQQQQYKTSNQNKSSRPYREIYRPPSMRSKSNRNTNSGNNPHPGNQNKCNNASNKSPNGPMTPMQNGNAIHNSPHMGRRQFNGIPPTKDFQMTMSQQQHLQNQQLVNLLQLGQLDPKFYGDVVANSNLGLYSLQQSKSLGSNLNALWQQQNSNREGGIQQQFPPMAYLQQNSQTILTAANFGRLVQSQGEKFNRLAQSRSSGSIPDTLNKPRVVRFDMDSDENEDMDPEATLNMIKNAETKFSGLNLNGMPQMKQQLQKSRTGFVLNMQSQTPQQKSGRNAGILKPEAVPGVIKRSRSFGAGPVEEKHQPINIPFGHSVYSDFQISRWPKRVQETVTTSVTAVERVAARQQIELVNLVFESMLQPNFDNECGHEDSDLSTPAVHIFIYFIQREKDRTVMESLLNTCFATYQKLFGSSAGHTLTFDSSPPASQSGTFLRFLSALYSQVRLLRRQKPGGGRSMNEMSFSVLAITCDSCLAMLRSRLSSDSHSMGCLFTVMTSQGRDMEGTFPLKMKQLLAAVRDALLGLGPYSQGPLCTTVQKTLMQLIELHAANWALPASAVRYYYSNNNNNSQVKNNSLSVGGASA